MRALSPGERRLLVEAGLLVGAVRLGLWLLPFRDMRRALAALARRPCGPGREAPPRQVVWAVEATSRRIPRASCLTQALAAQVLLARRGHAARLRLGAGRDPAGRFEAHAWIEDDTGILLGAPEPGRFTPFPPFEAPAP